MVHVPAGGRPAALMAALVVFALSQPGPALAQAPASPEPDGPLPDMRVPDPSAPLDPMPDLGVEWPDLESDEDGLAVEPAPVREAATTRRYSVRLEGLDEAEGVEARFRALSVLEENRGTPANAAQLDRRARADADLLADLLRARGHYDAGVATRVAQDGAVLVVILSARPGPLYHFSEVRLPGIEAAGGEREALAAAFGVGPGDPVDAAAVETGQAALAVALGARGFAFAEIGPRDVLVDHDSRTAILTLPVRPEGARRFGRVRVEGDAPFGARHVETIARFAPGDPYRAPLIEDLRRALVATGLVSTVAIRPEARPDGDVVDLAVAMDRAPARTIAGEAGYGTGEGVRVEASWQHRNLIRPEGAVTFRGVAGTREQLVSAGLRRNNFLERDQVLTAQVVASHVDRRAYDARSFMLAGGIERQTNIIWQKNWIWSVGAELIATDERDVDIDSGTTRRRTFLIAALPALLAYDGSDDLLDPTAGFRLAARFSPEASLQSGAFGYGRFQIDASAYHPLSDRVTLAGRTRIGTIFGASRDRIAPSRRFYAGGGGSVRGYGFQRLGPRDPVFDDPIGGRSLTEFALEARIRMGNFGIVPFIDAGNISTSPLPRFEDLRFGAGLGVRYHTRFGPIRVDVGTPLNPRADDPRIAVYVSLGQAF